ncbi:MAG: hypothetical protein NTU84_05725, partial [Verrucomicrobia bacterium]|nr:hypothetical protein [Verrucomicrobiota bacterium]
KNDTSNPTNPATTASITFKRHKRRRNSANRSCSDSGIGTLGDGDDCAIIQVTRSVQQNKTRPSKLPQPHPTPQSHPNSPSPQAAFHHHEREISRKHFACNKNKYENIGPKNHESVQKKTEKNHNVENFAKISSYPLIVFKNTTKVRSHLISPR